MDPKQIEVECPCCSGRLWIDVRSGKVTRWRHAGGGEGGSGGPSARGADETVEPPSGWDVAMERVRARGRSASTGFESALERERDRESALDDLFDRKQANLRGAPGERQAPPEHPSRAPSRDAPTHDATEEDATEDDAAGDLPGARDQ